MITYEESSYSRITSSTSSLDSQDENSEFINRAIEDVACRVLSLGGTKEELNRIQYKLNNRNIKLNRPIEEYIYTVNFDSKQSPDLVADFTSRQHMSIFNNKKFDFIYFSCVPTSDFDFYEAFNIANSLLSSDGILLFVGGVFYDHKKVNIEKYARDNVCDVAGVLALAGFNSGKTIKMPVYNYTGWEKDVRNFFNISPELAPSNGECIIASKTTENTSLSNNLSECYLKLPIVKAIIDEFTFRDADEIYQELWHVSNEKTRKNEIINESEGSLDMVTINRAVTLI